MARTASIADTATRTVPGSSTLVAPDPAAGCVDLVLSTLAAANGDRVIIRTGQVPVMVVAGRERALARDPLSSQAVRKIAKSLLPPTHLQALADVGETKYELPVRLGLPREEFDLRVVDTDRVLAIEIRRRPRSAHVAGVAERVAAGLRIDAEAVRALADFDARKQVAVGRVDRVDLGVVAA